MGLRVGSAAKIGHQASYNFKVCIGIIEKNSIFKEFTTTGVIVIGGQIGYYFAL